MVKNDIIKKTEYDKLVVEVNGVDNTNFVSKTTYEKDGSNFEDKINKIEKKIPDISSLVKKTDFNTKVTEIEGKIPDVSSLVKKSDFDTRLKKINDRVTKNKNKHLLVENELKKLKTFDLSYFLGKNYFEGNNGAQNALVFQTMQKRFKLMNKNQIDKWKSKGLSNRYLSTFGTIGDVILSKPIKPMRVIFKGKGTLIQDENDIISGGPMINIYIVYKTSQKTINSNFDFSDCLFGAIKITNTTNSDTDKWQYSGYGIGFDSTGNFTHPDGGIGRNAIIFGAGLRNSTVHSNNKTQSVLVLGHGLI